MELNHKTPKPSKAGKGGEPAVSVRKKNVRRKQNEDLLYMFT